MHSIAAAFKALQDHAESLASTHTRDLFARDANRFETFSITVDDLLFDYSKHKVTRETLDLLAALAKARRLEERRAALF
ncbi:MAG TPA: glucose-6-phosphate isomerase, partial [Methylocystis sp.]|nr:glucose-6-phosphate isomerase [Methylocystis sp.]